MIKKILILLLLGLVGLGCQKDDNAAKRLAYMEEFATAEVVIERMRKNENPDWNAIKKQYAVCSKLVKEVDERNHTDYFTAIPDALAKCANNESVKVNQQTLSKGLQHIAVMKIYDLIGSMANSDSTTKENIVNEITAVFDGIRPTFIRRDKDYFDGRKLLEKEADLALAELKASSGSGYITAASKLESAINRTYALCVLFEMQSIEKLRETNIPKCDVKLAEAIIFYRIIEPRIKKTNRKAHQTITAILKAEYSAVNSEQLIEALTKGLSMKIL
ncbi:MAG: hypothetical protein GY710_17385 [Desulfobacteraceae bacterium]|nr:hypothetical protein [Desulfobacteraceae bacterium]